MLPSGESGRGDSVGAEGAVKGATKSRGSGLWVLVGAAVIGVGLLVVLYHFSGQEPPPETPAQGDPFPIPPRSETMYLNAGTDSHYIGTAACAACHPSSHATYQLTPHSKALADIDLRAEPPDGKYDHALSGRSYRVYRQGDQFRHEEVLKTAEGKEIARIDLPVRYVIGSGNYCRSYIVEVDGFLHESPITWYTARQRWDMSPGYDFAQHWSFERPIRVGCIGCHSGQVEAVGGSVNKFAIGEKAIGCENCHGPGSTHQAAHRAKSVPTGADDHTIVHPGKLTRSLREAICASCHLSGVAFVAVRGRSFADYRPGSPLTDVRIHYRLDSDNSQMTVVGHVEQLRLSKCYQQSPSMTCVTCHDPHHQHDPKDQVQHFRKRCLECHESRPCHLAPAERFKKEPADNCAACHMPRGDTEIPHIAFTHHRIGRHSKASPPAPSGPPRLVPIDESPLMGPVDRERNLGLAYLELARNPVYARYAEASSRRAQEHLETVRAAGLRDGETTAALAELAWNRQDFHVAAAYAREALEAKDTPPSSRTISLMTVAEYERQSKNPKAAIAALNELVHLRRMAEDWRLMGVNALDMNRPDLALPAYEHALSIRPYRSMIHVGLAEVFSRMGDPVREKDHTDKANWLVEHRQQ